MMFPFVTKTCRISQIFGRIRNYLYFCSVKDNKKVKESI